MAVRREGPGARKTKKLEGRDTERNGLKGVDLVLFFLFFGGIERKVGRYTVCFKGALTHNTWTLRKIVKPVSSQRKII